MLSLQKFNLMLSAKHRKKSLMLCLVLGGKMPTETANSFEEHSYSKVYKLLVNGEDDLVGQIAYAIYKQQKIEKITRFTTQNKRPPSDEELSSFMENAESETQRRFYNDRAVSILKEFLEQSLTAEVDEINLLPLRGLFL